MFHFPARLPSIRLLAALAAVTPVIASSQTASAGVWEPSPAFIEARQRDIHSASTGRDYRICISVPKTPPPAAGFPILYLLDGDTAFAPAALFAQQWRTNGPAIGIHPGIVVGIVHKKTDADKNPRVSDFTPPAPDLSNTGDFSDAPQGGADRFLDFIENELKPLLASELPIDAKRQTLFGHSYGGLFTLHVLFNRPTAFQRYVAASPSVWWNNRHILTERDAFLRSSFPALLKASAVPALVLSVGDLEQTPLPHHHQRKRAAMVSERRQVDNARELAASLNAAGLKTRLYVFENENHGSSRVPAINHAIRIAFGE